MSFDIYDRINVFHIRERHIGHSAPGEIARIFTTPLSKEALKFI